LLTADVEGFDAFVAARSPALLRAAYLLTGDHHLSQDLVQTALLQAAKHWERIHEHPEPYVRRILYNTNVSWWRRRKVAEYPIDDGDRAAPTEDTDARLALAEALAGLTRKQRAVLVLRYYEDMTERQAADALGVSVGTVKSTTRQALDRLRSRAPHLAALLGKEAEE